MAAGSQLLRGARSDPVFAAGAQWVLSLEVGEHIPVEHEGAVLRGEPPERAAEPPAVDLEENAAAGDRVADDEALECAPKGNRADDKALECAPKRSRADDKALECTPKGSRAPVRRAY